jgi:hypothetical protein
MGTYIYREDSGYSERFGALDDDDAGHYAEGLLRGGDWGQDSAGKTFRVRAHVARIEIIDGIEDEVEGRTVTVTFGPHVPPCPGREDHDWQQGPSYGSGGGVKYTDTCAACGLRCTTDTWDHDPAAGEVMETVTCEPAAVAR